MYLSSSCIYILVQQLSEFFHTSPSEYGNRTNFQNVVILYKELERQMKSKEITLNNPSYHHQVTFKHYYPKLSGRAT
jgi:hypothetical protein